MFPDTWIVKRKIPMPKTNAVWGWQRKPTVTIYPVGDLHLGSIGCNERAWSDFVNYIQSDDDAYIVCVGDMMDNGLKTSKIVNPFDQKYRPSEQKNILAGYLKPIKHKILACVSGNHEQRSKDSDDFPLYDVFCRLDIEECYRQGTAFLYLQIGNRESNEKDRGRRNRPEQTYNIVLTHGVGGSARQIGTGLNNGVRFGQSIDGADCIVTGHTHTPTICKPSKTIFDPHQDEIRTSPFAAVQCASWLSYCGYPLQKMMTPQTAWDNNNPQKIQLCAVRNSKLIRVSM